VQPEPVQPGISDILTAVAGHPRPVVIIDGRSGSGKTELANRLAPALGAQLVRLDDLYPGWDGLAEASESVVRDILGAHRWQRWDWERDAPAEWHDLDPAAPLVVEGSGSLTAASRRGASYAIWVELDEPTRKSRALARDGSAYESHWERWAAQERGHFSRNRPDHLADRIVEG
jgi:cytidylate kinase